MRVAALWGVPRRVVLAESFDELMWWQAYYALEPWGRNGETVQQAVVAASLIQAFTGEKVNADHFLKEPPRDPALQDIGDDDLALIKSLQKIRPQQPRPQHWTEDED
jgi:hypothetical protein